MNKQREAAIIAAYLTLTVLATYPLALRAGSAIPVGGDSWSNYWNLWWIKTALVERLVNPYFTPDLHFPYGATLYFHTVNLVGGIISLPIVIAFGIADGYNFLVLASFLLSGYGGYRLTFYVLARQNPTMNPDRAMRLGAFVAGIAFTFSSYRYLHLFGHLDLVSTQWLPFSMLFLLKVRDQGGWWNVVMAASFLAAATLTASYYMVFLLVFTAYVVVDLLLRPSKESSRQVLRMVATVAAFAIAISPVLVPMLLLGRTEGRASNVAQDLERFSADALAFVVPSPLNPLWRDVVTPIYRVIAPDGGFETVAFAGFVPLAFGAIGLRCCPAVRRFWLSPLLLFTLLALGPVMHVAGQVVLPWLAPVMPYSLLARLPYGDIPRVPARYVVMVTLCLSVTAGAGAWTLMRRLKLPLQVATTGLLTILATSENAVVPLPLMTVDEPPFFKQIREDPRRTGILEIPIQNDRPDIPERMLYQTIHGKPIYGGYFSRAQPVLQFSGVPGFAQLQTLSESIDDVVIYDAAQLPDISRAVLNFYTTGYVVIERKFMASAAVERARQIADRLLGASSRVYQDGGMLAYAVPQTPSAAPAAVWLDTGWSYLERLADRGPDGRSLRWRWMGDRARLGVISREPARVRLKFTAQAFGRARRVQLGANGSAIATLAISPDRAAYETPFFQLTPDVKMIELRSLDGAESPGLDQRRLSIALYQMELVAE